jgi:uncharacterized membrane protein
MALPLLPVLTVAASSLFWAGLDVSRKLLVGRIRALAAIVLLTAGAVPLFAAWWLWDGIARAGAPAAGYWAPATASVLLNVGANLAFLEAMRLAPLSLVTPLMSLTPAFTAILSVPLLGEVPSPRAIAGIALVVAGALWLNRSSRPARGDGVPPEEGRRRRIGALLAVLTAFTWALTLPIDKLALEKAPAAFHGLVLNAGVAVIVILVLAARRGLGELGAVRGNQGLLLAVIALSFCALGLQLLALPLIFAGTLETLKRGIGNFSAVLFGRLIFHEPIHGRKLGAVAVMVAGVAMMLL